MDCQSQMKAIMTKINQLWRLIATAVGFCLFGLGGVILLWLLWFNVLRLFVWDKKRRTIIAQYSISLSFKVFLWIIKLLGVIDYQFIGLEKIKHDKHCLIVANHPSLLDFVLLASVMPRCDCMVKESLLKNFFVGGIIKTAGYIPNTEANKMLPHCQQTLNADGRILIFPEGTRSIPNQPIKLQRGAANIALRCQADIRIININCQPAMLIKNQKWYQIPHKKPIFTITVNEKLAISEFINDNITVAARKLTQYLTLKLTPPIN